MTGIIYMAFNNRNGKIYIGRTTRSLHDRKRYHISASKNKNYYKAVFYKAIRKYGQDNFSWKIIEICDELGDMCLAEEWYIRYYDTFIPKGYNMSFGGGSNKGWKMPMESRLKIRNARIGKKHPEEVKRKISASNLISQNKVNRSGCNNPMYGRTGANSPTAKKYIVTFPDDREEVILGIKEFSRKYGLDSSGMVKCAKNKCNSHKGYRCSYYI